MTNLTDSNPTTRPTHAAGAAQERRAFGNLICKIHGTAGLDMLARDESGAYTNSLIQAQWAGWLARAEMEANA